jgi:hypothetical protein
MLQLIVGVVSVVLGIALIVRPNISRKIAQSEYWAGRLDSRTIRQSELGLQIGVPLFLIVVGAVFLWASLLPR